MKKDKVDNKKDDCPMYYNVWKIVRKAIEELEREELLKIANK